MNSFITYKCGCCIDKTWLHMYPACRIHDQPVVVESSANDWQQNRKRKRLQNASIYLSSFNHFVEHASLDLSCVVIENPNSLVHSYLRDHADKYLVIENMSNASSIQTILESDYSLYLNCSIGQLYKNLRGKIHTPFPSVFRFLHDADYRNTIQGQYSTTPTEGRIR